jgi:hypothetical protein
MPNPTGANGGGSFTNEYTLLFDIFTPAGSARSSWRSLFQSNTSNSNDAEYFIRNTDDKLGISAPLGYSGNAITEGSWSRVVLVFDDHFCAGACGQQRPFILGCRLEMRVHQGGGFFELFEAKHVATLTWSMHVRSLASKYQNLVFCGVI